MPANPQVTWAVLADIETVAACMPGAKITERLDDRHFKGTVTVKLGPAMLNFRGEIEVQELDAAKRTLHLVAKGTDTSGSSAASLDLTARVDPTADGSSALIGSSEAGVSGKAAVFGGRMMEGLADQILKQFAANFAARVELLRPAPDAVATGVAGKPAAPTPPPQRPLNGFALLWAMVKDWLRGLFAKKTA